MAKKDKRLGKGLDAIFGDNLDSVLDDINKGDIKHLGEVNRIAIDEIRTNPYQPRKIFDEEALKGLAESIREFGVVEPIIVRKGVKGYELIAGERRLRASKLADLKDIPAVVVEFTDQEMMEISLLENLQREDLTAIEEAEAYQQLIEKFAYTQEQLSDKLGKSRSHVTNLLRLLKLPKKVQQDVNEGKLSMGHARALLAVEEEEDMLTLEEKAIREGLSVREVEKLAKKKKTEPRPVKEKDPYIADVEKTLSDHFQTKVEITGKTLSISYKSVDDLNRILEMLDCLDSSKK